MSLPSTISSAVRIKAAALVGLTLLAAGCLGDEDPEPVRVGTVGCGTDGGAPDTGAAAPDAAAPAPDADDAGASDAGAPTPDAAAPAPDAATADAAPSCATCAVELATPVFEGANHALECTPLTHGSKPPASGTHYGFTAAFRVYTQPVPWGFLLHSMEHGAVVIAYNCADGCPADVAAAKALWEATTKKACGKPPVIVTPDPTLDVRFAAAAWGATLRAPCFDRQAFAAFVERHANMGPEFFPQDCGALDREGSPWCQ
jgi:hypothetical protein